MFKSLVIVFALFTASASMGQIKPDITKGYAHIVCNWTMKGWDHIQAFSFTIEDGKLTYQQPSTGKTYNDTVELIHAGVANTGDDYVFGFYGKKSAALKMVDSKAQAISIFVPGKFLSNPHVRGTKATVDALLSTDRNGRSLKGKGISETFSCYRAG